MSINGVRFGYGYGYGTEHVQAKRILSLDSKTTEDLTSGERVAVTEALQIGRNASVAFEKSKTFLNFAEKKIEVFSRIQQQAQALVNEYKTKAFVRQGVQGDTVAEINARHDVFETNRYITANRTYQGLDIYGLQGAHNVRLGNETYDSGLAADFTMNGDSGFLDTRNFAAVTNAVNGGLGINGPATLQQFVTAMETLVTEAGKAISNVRQQVTNNPAFKAAQEIEEAAVEHSIAKVEHIYKDVDIDALAEKTQRTEHLAAILAEMQMASIERLRRLIDRIAGR
jgi:hypothetical protein